MSYSFSFQQNVLPPSGAGQPALTMGFRFGQVVAASRGSTSAVLSGSNLFIGAPFATAMDRPDETLYFYSATSLIAATTANYLWVQSLRLTTKITTNFASSIALSPDDSTIIVGAPGYTNVPVSDSRYQTQGAIAGRAYVFNWNRASGSAGAYTMQAILNPAVASGSCSAVTGESGFGVAVAMSGNTFAVASMGRQDVTGTSVPGIGNLYIYQLGASQGGIGQVSASSVPRCVQVIPSLPVSNALALSMAGNYIVVGVQMVATVNIILNRNFANPSLPPDYSQTSSSFRTTLSASAGSSANTGMGQVVTSQLVGGRLYAYTGQPNANTGAVWISQAPNTVQMRSQGTASGLLPGFGASAVFNTRGNYLYAGNFLNQPHALVLSLYFATLGNQAQTQLLVSNDAQTAGAGVFSNYGSVVETCPTGNAILVGIGASLGPSLDGRVYLYSTTSGTSSGSFSLQAILAGTGGANFGASMQIAVQGSAVGIVVGAPNFRNGYVNLYVAGNPQSISASTTPFQRLNDPTCTPLSNQFSCGSNYGGALAMDTQTIVVGAHNMGLQPSTGRVYIYMPRTDYGGQAFFTLQQTLMSPAQEYGFGVSVQLGSLSQNAHQRPIPGMTSGTFTVVIVSSTGPPSTLCPNWPDMPNNVGGAYVYVRIGRQFSVLQMLVGAPTPLSSAAGTGWTQSVMLSQRNLYIGSIYRNVVYVYQYNGVSRYTQMQILRAPNGAQWGGEFGSSMYANPANNGLAVAAPYNGTVYFYNLQPTSGFSLIKVVQAQPNANNFGAAMDFTAGRFIFGAPGANVAGVYSEQLLMNLPFARPSPSPSFVFKTAAERKLHEQQQQQQQEQEPLANLDWPQFGLESEVSA